MARGVPFRSSERGKRGLIEYPLEDLGLDAAERREALSFYGERFEIVEG